MDLDDDRDLLLGMVIVLAALLLVYSVLVPGDILVWVSLVFPLVVLYLAWRFVRAHERIADALETSPSSNVDDGDR